MKQSTRTLVLGRLQFVVRSTDARFLADLEKMLSVQSLPEPALADSTQVIDLDALSGLTGAGGADMSEEDRWRAVSAIVDYATANQPAGLWLDATTMIDLDGRPVLIAGASFAGKTTLTAALALACGWRVVCEDITFVDIQAAVIFPFARPLSLRAGSAALIEGATGLVPEPIVWGGWWGPAEIYSPRPVPLAFSRACFLSGLATDSGASLAVTAVSPEELFRLIVRRSNLLRFPAAIDPFVRALPAGHLSVIAGGSVSERLTAIKGS